MPRSAHKRPSSLSIDRFMPLRVFPLLHPHELMSAVALMLRARYLSRFSTLNLLALPPPTPSPSPPHITGPHYAAGLCSSRSPPGS